MNFLFGRSRLKRAIEQGLAKGTLDDELRELGDFKLKSRADADAVCWGLQQLVKGRTKQLGEKAYALAGLFQQIEDEECDAVQVLHEEGIPELLRLFDEIQSAPAGDESNPLLFILKILALYGTTDGTLKVLEAARQPLKPDGYLWSVILGIYKPGHPQNELLYGSLRDPLPPDFIGVSLLDAANACLIEGAAMPHPFDTAEGKQRLRAWLTNTAGDEPSYAHSATAALPFITDPGRDELLNLAMKHPDAGVQIEAAWAAAKLGRDEGLCRLVDSCRELQHAQVAKRYLGELGRDDLIPPEAKDPNFEALAEFAQWLAHPSELGRSPDDLQIVDHRQLAWPPERELKPFWLIKYTVRDTTGLGEDDVECGLVGSTTFCFFSYKLAQRPPEDAYAVHCYWELEQAGLIKESDVQEDPGEYEVLLKQWRGRALENPQVLFVAELSPELRCPQRLVGLASARLEGTDGWVVLDGERSEWYPKSDMPPDAYESIVLKIHIGRHLLGFTDKPDRQKYVAAPVAPKPAEQIIAAYQKLLAEAQPEAGAAREKVFDICGPLETHFDRYADALVCAGRAAEMASTIQLLAPHWEHCSGYLKLGAGAFKCGQFELAESFLLKARDKCANWERSEEMALLAQIWCQRGRPDEAKVLLLDCLRRLLAESKTASGSDKQLFENWFQNQRTALLRLFPSDGEADLAVGGIPGSTLN